MLDITREEFNTVCQDVFNKCLEPIDMAMSDAGLQKSQIDEIILVGGSSRLLKMQEMLSEYFEGKQLNKSINPDEAVAIGATISAGICAGAESVSDIFI